MNIFWLIMMASSLLVLLITDPGVVVGELVGASKSALALCVDLCAIYTIWLGFLELLDASGLSIKLAKLLHPIVKRVFKINDPETERIIALNLSANMLGLGNAATPLGIKAMKRLDDGSGKATFAAIMLIIINTTSIQLLPTTVIGLRESAGSTSSTDIIIPTLIATTITTTLGIFIAHFFNKITKKGRTAS